MHYIIGCGGVGSWLCPSLCMLVGLEHVCVIDGDKLEEKNLNRQLFNPLDAGSNKAAILSRVYHCDYRAQWYNTGLIAHTPEDWLFVCVDNNPARLSALAACDDYGCRAIVAANETNSAESYLYLPDWRDTPRDPRIMYPDMMRDKSGDPQRAAIGCTGEAQKQNRQLVSANFMAAALAQHLFVLWGIELPKMEGVGPDIIRNLPHKLVANLSSLETHKIGRSNPEPEKREVMPLPYTPQLSPEL